VIKEIIHKADNAGRRKTISPGFQQSTGLSNKKTMKRHLSKAENVTRLSMVKPSSIKVNNAEDNTPTYNDFDQLFAKARA
jgi:hypothetical protein